VFLYKQLYYSLALFCAEPLLTFVPCTLCCCYGYFSHGRLPYL